MNQQMKQGLGGPTPVAKAIKGTCTEPHATDDHAPIKNAATNGKHVGNTNIKNSDTPDPKA
jgi:hypothetical protein